MATSLKSTTKQVRRLSDPGYPYWNVDMPLTGSWHPSQAYYDKTPEPVCHIGLNERNGLKFASVSLRT
ncbi:hypothetical protein CCM_04051 [Cordyceps militaris CM01]|uniref:Uncharacterized protein n=1 Tax=Cordyceps militaris (strain CM01) TaxID=983644 RepID=G3JDK3_CORMM|nr:uncharacterized protein CCM_04051 [Cordyceps militaris CM01]EGX92678.1 hypothetical protein CCM_04051 [Cordyceps militaris CM01]